VSTARSRCASSTAARPPRGAEIYSS
jgi:hypothetical protein